MLDKPCPWCGEKISGVNFGKTPHLELRLRKEKPKWYQFTKSVLICPHCKKCVKTKHDNDRYSALLVAPFFILIFIQIFTQSEIINITVPKQPYFAISIVLLITGILLFVLKTEHVKETDL